MAVLAESMKGDKDSDTLLSTVSLRNTRIAAASSLLFIVSLGVITSYSAPATADMQKPGSRFKDITPNQVTWIGSLPNLGCLFGNLLSGYLTHQFGRKTVLMFTSIVYMLSWLMVIYAPTILLIYFGRFIGGVCAGLCVVAVPAYIVEIAPTYIRGQLMSGFQIAFTVGVLYVMSLGIFLRWSWLAVSAAVLIGCGATLMFFMPESPPWLVRKSRTEEAEMGLIFFKGKESNIERELQHIKDNIAEPKEEELNFRDFKNPELYKPTGIALSLMFFQQACGISPLLSYTVEIFETIGSSVEPTTAATIVAVVQVIATILSGSLMDRSGRRKLFITSGICMSVSLAAIGAYSFVIKQYTVTQKSFGFIPLISFIVYIFSYSLGNGPIPYVMIPEMVPIKYRSPVIALAGVWCSLLAFVANKVFDDMRRGLNDYGVYWTYGSFSLLSAVFGYWILPETKGLTIREISKSFTKSNDIVK